MREDTELMSAFALGDEDAFCELVERHQSRVLNFLYRMTWDRSLSEDLTQEVFTKLFRTASRYEPRAKFTTYLYRIATNCWIDLCRKRTRRGKMVSLDAGWQDGSTLADSMSDTNDNPVDALGRRETYNACMKAVNGLSEEHRAVFVLGEMQGLPYKDIAETLGIPVGTVKSRMFTAVRKLREELKPTEVTN